VVKKNPFVNQSVSLNERFSAKPASDSSPKAETRSDVVRISNEAKRKHVMGQLIARISAEYEPKKLG